jgi:peptidoglycan/xylan/chitin deacetylase (PgdA/CDA1 family)
VYPSAARAVAEAGWELVGHSVIQRSLQGEPDETATIAETMRLLEQHTGRRPRGWLGPGFGETPDTPDHLKAAGIDFLFEWMVDDLPCWMRTRHGPMIAVPYALDLNDVMVFALEKHPAEEYVSRFAATVAVLEPELEQQPRVLTVALHPHVIAVPYRFDALRRVLDMLQARHDTIFLTGSAIADWFSAATGGPAGAEAREAQALAGPA